MGIFALPYASMALSLFLASTCAAAKATEAALAHDRPGESVEWQTGGGRNVPLSVNDRIRDILNHPSFSGFARLILPWDDRPYDENMPLTDIGSLLPYHSHVHPETVVGSLNRMIAEAVKGRTVFYDFYTEKEKQEQPAREHTGLFFSAEDLGHPLRSSLLGAGSPMSALSTKAFPT